MTATTAPILAISPTAEPTSLGPIQMAWLAGAIFVVSAGYGALLPLLPDWLTSVLPGASVPDVSRHVGFISGVYAVGVLAGAPLWGLLSDRVGRRRVLIVGLTGYITSQILLLVPGLPRLWEIYMLRAAAGFFVAAIVPVVAALIAEYSSEDQRARRFAWLGAMSLLGFLIGPGLTAVADWMGSWVGDGASSPILSVQIVLALSASLGGVTMLGLVLVLPPARVPYFVVQAGLDTEMRNRPYVLWGLSGVLMFVLAGFELGIVL